MSTTSVKSPNPLHSISTLLGRLILGVVLIAHGWQKLKSWGPEQTQSKFEGMGAPMPELSSQIATWVELVGGILIVLGLLSRIVGPIIFLQMMGAAIIAHRSNGIFVSDGGWELVAAIGAAGLFLGASGAGAISVDYLLMTPFRARRARKQREQENNAATMNGSFNDQFQPAGQQPLQSQSTQQTQQPGSFDQFENPTSSPQAADADSATQVFRAPDNK